MMKDTVEIIEGHIGILKGCISAEELQFVMNHLPGKVRCNIMKLPAKIKIKKMKIQKNYQS